MCISSLPALVFPPSSLSHLLENGAGSLFALGRPSTDSSSLITWLEGGCNIARAFFHPLHRVVCWLRPRALALSAVTATAIFHQLTLRNVWPMPHSSLPHQLYNSGHCNTPYIVLHGSCTDPL